MRKGIIATASAIAALLVFSSAALGFEFTNASKSDPSAGAQILFGPAGEILSISNGLANRIERGVVDAETGEGFHGLVAIDVDGDGAADFSTWINVGPNGEIPLHAQLNGPACRGLTNLFVYMAECLGG